MSRDGLIPKFFGHIHPKYKTPVRSSSLICLITGITAGFLPINIVAELTNIGTLCAFIIVAAAVIVLRKKAPERPRAFKCPFVPVIPVLAIIFCAILIFMLPGVTQIRFVVWLLIGLAIYFGYGYQHSVISQAKQGNFSPSIASAAASDAAAEKAEGMDTTHTH